MKLAGKFGCEHLRGLTELGPFWLSRVSAVESKVLDNTACLDRLNTNKQMWYLVPNNYRPYTELKDIKKGLTAMIVGKGPGLDYLTSEICQKANVILACNESVHHVVNTCGDVPVYNLQCDPSAGSCHNIGATPVVVSECVHFYTEADPMYLARLKDFDTSRWHPVGCMAIYTAKHMGCSNIIFVGFDGAFKGKMGYADIIGKSPTSGKYSNPSRFSLHQRPMLKVLGDTPYTVLTPEEMDHETLTYDTLQPLQENHEEQNEHVHEVSQVEQQENSASLY